MANDIYTMTPGSAVADQLQTILANKRNEDRQKLLDSVGIVNAMSQNDYRAEQAKSLAEDRAAQAESRRALAAERYGNMYAPGQDLSPEDVAELQRQRLGGFVNPETTDSDFTGPVLPGTNPAHHSATWKGTAKQLVEQRKENRQDLALKELQTRAQDNPELQEQLLAREAGINLPAGVTKDTGGEVYTVKPDGTFEDSGMWDPRGPQYIHPPQAQHDPAALQVPQMWSQTIPDPAHPGQTIQESHWLRPGEMPNDKNRINGGPLAKTPPRVPSGGTGKTGVNPTLFKTYLGARQAAMANANDQARQETYFSARQQLIDSISQDPFVRNFIAQSLQAGDKNPRVLAQPASAIIAQNADAFTDPKRASEFSSIWDTIRSHQPIPEQ